jgi:transcriptional regulator with XRE-family HTH domain
MFEVASVDLEGFRKSAKVSQEEMAQRLGVSQSQVSRYEQNPDDVPQGVVNKWVAICGRISTKNGLDYGAPYKEISGQLRLMAEYADTAPQTSAPELFKDAPTADNFLAKVRLIARKPRVAICGRFDMGKSRMANTLMGGDRLPTAYQPATSIICLIRHIDDRPAWLREDVLILSKGFDLNRADDEGHCSDHKIVAGSFDTLRRYGTHGDEAKSEQCYAALVFIDSPFLLGCDLLDLPGYGHSESDHGKAEFAHHLADVLIYASTAQGFLDQNDLQFVSGLLKQLPVVENGDNGLPALRNVYFVATMARMEVDQLEGIVSKSSSRAFSHLEETLALRCGQPVTLADFRRRFFTFLVDDPTRRKLFEDDVSELLGGVYSRLIRAGLDRSVTELKGGAKNYWDSWAARLVEALEHRDRAQAALDQHEKAEPERQRRIGGKNERILTMIEDNKEATRRFIDGTLAELVTKDKVEKMIRDRYGDDKEEAQSLAASYLNEHVQNRLNKFLAHRANGLVPEIEDLLKDYENAGKVVGGLDVGAVAVPFNAQGVFLGAIAAAGTAGALTAWVAVATAGSNLGAYLLIPSVVSFLSSIGISVGGTASVISLVAAIGGPITILIGLTVVAFILAFALFGGSWQSRLAKKISETLKEKKLLQILTEHSDKYWDDTRKGFVTALADMEQTFQAYVGNLRNLATSTSREEMEGLIKEVGESRDFFGGIPWKSAR